MDVDSQSKGLDRIKHDDDAYTFGRRICSLETNALIIVQCGKSGNLFSDKVEIWTDGDGYPQGTFHM